MCYTGGPRCASHVGNELSAAHASVAVLESKGDIDGALVALEEQDRLQMEYNSTPTGQRELTAEIEALRKEGKAHQANSLESVLEAARGLREHDMEQRQKRLTAGDRLSRACERGPESTQETKRINAMDRLAAEARGEAVPVKTNPTSANKSPLVNVAPTTESYSDYDSHLVPQANSIGHISALVESVDSGANTSNSIAETLEMKGRQGHYYANAAVYLGLISKHDSAYEGGGHEYQLTENGQTVKNANPQERAEMIRKMVNATPLMRVYHESDRDEESVKEAIREMGLDDQTVDRRAAVVVSWDKAVNNQKFVAALDQLHTVSSGRAKLAAANLENERRERKLKEQKSNEDRGGYCQKHFTMRSPAGICFQCQDDE